MASTSFSWVSSSWLQNSTLTKTVNADTARVSDGAPVLKVVAQKKAKKVRKVILKEDVTKLGKKGELLDVKAGYFRNFLLPMGMAQIVTPSLINERSGRKAGGWRYLTGLKDGNGLGSLIDKLESLEMKMEDERIEAEKKRVKGEAQQLALIFETVGAFKVKRKGGKGKLIFGTVTAQDLVDIIKAQLDRDVDKRIVSLPEIRETGEYIAEIKLHPEVVARVRLNVYTN